MSDIVSVRINWHQHPDYGEQFEEYIVGKDYYFHEDNISRRCLEITENKRDGQHIEIKFEDGVVVENWNINRITRYESRPSSSKVKDDFGDKEIELLVE